MHVPHNKLSIPVQNPYAVEMAGNWLLFLGQEITKSKKYIGGFCRNRLSRDFGGGLFGSVDFFLSCWVWKGSGEEVG